MGMDVYGRKPKSPTGEYFRNNVWWWRPLWDYCCEVAPDLISPELADACHANDGKGLLATKTAQLADRLQAEIESGATALHAKAHQERLNAIPDEECFICNGTGTRPNGLRDFGEQWVKDNNGCNSCHGTGKTRPSATWYPFSVENVQEFVDFLRDSGGFKVL